MKKVVIISMSVLAAAVVIAILSFRSAGRTVNEEKSMVAGDKVEVIYFHFTRRCVTCQAVENVTGETVRTLYPDQLKNGNVSFTAVNLDEESSKPIAERCKVTGQTLLVLSGDVRVDLTDKGFMYATTSPDKLKAEIKKTIDPLLNPVK
ncbi:MAG TPA: nitrophenyl compound nitroreductase subunit ArsF family protein [Bacteroidales bacterium]|nr:nitrophenyl compound nitroreductase subunit ArsF family protein [Bacteroidales bacterium]